MANNAIIQILFNFSIASVSMRSADIVIQMTRGKIFLIFHSEDILFCEETCLPPCTVEFTKELKQGTHINRKFNRPNYPPDLPNKY